jgi:carboxylate-amine ligase
LNEESEICLERFLHVSGDEVGRLHVGERGNNTCSLLSRRFLPSPAQGKIVITLLKYFSNRQTVTLQRLIHTSDLRVPGTCSKLFQTYENEVPRLFEEFREQQKLAISIVYMSSMVGCTFISCSWRTLDTRGARTYRTIEVLGPEHEFSIVDDRLRVLPIVDTVLKDLQGRIVNSVTRSDFTLGKELQLHVLELKPNKPFRSPKIFEETMQKAVLFASDFLQRKHAARLLGTGMHPLLSLEETRVWPHRHRQIYRAYSRVFNLNQHGWLNIQSFQLNLPYSNEQCGIKLYNLLANVCAYLPAIMASSPVYEGCLGKCVDNRLDFYRLNQSEIPSVIGDVVPEYVPSFSEYRENIIEKYSSDMTQAGADDIILHKDWVNSRGAIFRFDRRAVEIRVMDEQECIKSDVAASCFIRALLRGLLSQNADLEAHELLVKDFNSIVVKGLNAETVHPYGRTARKVLQTLFETAWRNATEEEKTYLPLVKKRINTGSLSDIVRQRVERKAQKTDFTEAVVSVYSRLAESLMDNRPYF